MVFLKNIGNIKGVGRQSAGFTLIEVIAVLFVISLGLLGVLALIIQNIQSQSINKNTLVAYQLAQEGVELIRKNRDTHWNAPVPEAWDLDFPGVDAQDNYYMSYSDSQPSKVVNAEDIILKQDEDGFYYHGLDGTPSGFSRVIYLDRLNQESLLVRVTVSWTDYTSDRSYSLETILYDWR